MKGQDVFLFFFFAVCACRYSPNELRYLPLNTALYEPPLDPELPALDSDGDSDDAEDGKGEDGKKNKGSSVRFKLMTGSILISNQYYSSLFSDFVVFKFNYHADKSFILPTGQFIWKHLRWRQPGQWGPIQRKE